MKLFGIKSAIHISNDSKVVGDALVTPHFQINQIHVHAWIISHIFRDWNSAVWFASTHRQNILPRLCLNFRWPLQVKLPLRLHLLMIIFLNLSKQNFRRMIAHSLVPKWRGRLVQTFKKQIQSIASIYCQSTAPNQPFQCQSPCPCHHLISAGRGKQVTVFGARNRPRNKRCLSSSSKSWRIKDKVTKTTDINSTTGFKRICTISCKINQGVTFSVFKWYCPWACRVKQKMCCQNWDPSGQPWHHQWPQWSHQCCWCPPGSQSSLLQAHHAQVITSLTRLKSRHTRWEDCHHLAKTRNNLDTSAANTQGLSDEFDVLRILSWPWGCRAKGRTISMEALTHLNEAGRHKVDGLVQRRTHFLYLHLNLKGIF